MSKNERQSGQATVITVIFMTVLIAMAAAVLDIGSWYRADRALQATVEGAAVEKFHPSATKRWSNATSSRLPTMSGVR